MMTLPRFQSQAQAYWSSHGLGRSPEHCAHRLAVCCSFLSACRYAEEIQPRHGQAVLAGLKQAGFSPASIRAYYATLKSAHRICGLAPIQWPRAPKSPRVRPREAMCQEDLSALISYFEDRGWHNTADLARVLNGCGLRVGREALEPWACEYDPKIRRLHITGKGGHQRSVSVVDAGARAVLEDHARREALCGVGIDAHRYRWRKALKAIGGGRTALPSPHSLRHKFATEILGAGAPLLMVRDMLGHSNVQTTAGYVMPDYAGMEAWLRKREGVVTEG